MLARFGHDVRNLDTNEPRWAVDLRLKMNTTSNLANQLAPARFL